MLDLKLKVNPECPYCKGTGIVKHTLRASALDGVWHLPNPVGVRVLCVCVEVENER